MPPRERRWKPGQSGNPAGRPKGTSTSFESTIERELSKRVDGDPLKGDKGRISRRTRIARTFLDRVEAGDPRLTKLLLERLWRIPTEPPNLSSPIVVVMDNDDLQA